MSDLVNNSYTLIFSLISSKFILGARFIEAIKFNPVLKELWYFVLRAQLHCCHTSSKRFCINRSTNTAPDRYWRLCTNTAPTGIGE